MNKKRRLAAAALLDRHTRSGGATEGDRSRLRHCFIFLGQIKGRLRLIGKQCATTRLADRKSPFKSHTELAAVELHLPSVGQLYTTLCVAVTFQMSRGHVGFNSRAHPSREKNPREQTLGGKRSLRGPARTSEEPAFAPFNQSKAETYLQITGCRPPTDSILLRIGL